MPYVCLGASWCPLAHTETLGDQGVRRAPARSGVVRGLAGDPRRPRWPGAQTDGGGLPVFQVPILIPCHRVVCSSGAMGNYSGGLATKEWLLAHEGRLAGKPTDPRGPHPAGRGARGGRR